MIKRFLMSLVGLGFASLVAIGSSGSRAYAIIDSGNFNYTLQELVDNPSIWLQVGDKIFREFDAITEGFNLDYIHVKPRITTVDGVEEMGLFFQFTGSNLVVGGQEGYDLHLEFDVHTFDYLALIVDDYLSVTGGAAGGGYVSITEDVKDWNNQNGDSLDNMAVLIMDGYAKTSDIGYFDPMAHLRIFKDINIFSGITCPTPSVSGCVDYATISDFSQLFSQIPPTTGDTSGNSTGTSSVPEPASMMLLGFGAAGLAAWRRRRVR